MSQIKGSMKFDLVEAIEMGNYYVSHYEKSVFAPKSGAEVRDFENIKRGGNL